MSWNLVESLPVGLYENANFFSGFRLFFGNQKLKDIKKYQIL